MKKEKDNKDKMREKKMKAIIKTEIQVGLLSIPVKLYSAVNKETEGLFCNISADGNPVGHKNYDKVTGKDVEFGDIQKAIKMGKDEFIPVEKEELKQLEVDNTNLEVIGQKNFSEFDLRQYGSQLYYTSPDSKNGKNFALFREMLKKLNKALVIKGTLRGKENFYTLYPKGDTMVLQEVRANSAIRNVDDLGIDRETITPEELKEGTKLFKQLLSKTDCDLSELKNEYADRVKEFVTAKASGVATVVVAKKKVESNDLMSQLKKSIGE